MEYAAVCRPKTGRLRLREIFNPEAAPAPGKREYIFFLTDFKLSKIRSNTCDMYQYIRYRSYFMFTLKKT